MYLVLNMIKSRSGMVADLVLNPNSLHRLTFNTKGPFKAFPEKDNRALEACAMNRDPFKVRQYILLFYIQLSWTSGVGTDLSL